MPRLHWLGVAVAVGEPVHLVSGQDGEASGQVLCTLNTHLPLVTLPQVSLRTTLSFPQSLSVP